MSEPSLPRTLREIQTCLGETPTEAHLRFEALLGEALSMDDFEWVYNLLTAAQPLLAEHLYLKQWHIYASAYLTLEDKRQPVEAIALFESLRTQLENLAPNLPGRVLNSLGIAYEENEQWDRAIHCYEQCIQLCEARSDDLGLAKAWHNLAIVHYKGQDYFGLPPEY